MLNMKNNIPCGRQQKRTEITVFVSDEAGFKKNYKERHYTMMKGWIHQGDIIITNICISNIRAPKHVKQIY